MPIKTFDPQNFVRPIRLNLLLCFTPNEIIFGFKIIFQLLQYIVVCLLNVNVHLVIFEIQNKNNKILTSHKVFSDRYETNWFRKLHCNFCFCFREFNRPTHTFTRSTFYASHCCLPIHERVEWNVDMDSLPQQNIQHMERNRQNFVAFCLVPLVVCRYLYIDNLYIYSTMYALCSVLCTSNYTLNSLHKFVWSSIFEAKQNRLGFVVFASPSYMCDYKLIKMMATIKGEKKKNYHHRTMCDSYIAFYTTKPINKKNQNNK